MNSSDENNLRIILLAAGQGLRFGSTKQLAEIKGISLINHSLTQLLPLACEILVVLGANAEMIQSRLIKNSNIKVIINSDWAEGLGCSISLAVKTITQDKSTPEVKHLLLALADQVALTTADFKRLLASAKNNSDKIICAEYLQTVGVPAIFPKEFFKELDQLSGDTGAKMILQKKSEQLLKLLLPRAAIDIDTQQDLLDWTDQVS